MKLINSTNKLAWAQITLKNEKCKLNPDKQKIIQLESEIFSLETQIMDKNNG